MKDELRLAFIDQDNAPFPPQLRLQFLGNLLREGVCAVTDEHQSAARCRASEEREKGTIGNGARMNGVANLRSSHWRWRLSCWRRLGSNAAGEASEQQQATY